MPPAKKAKGLKVTAPLVQVDIAGRSSQFYRGDILPEGVSDESLEHLKGLGYVDEVDAPESDDK
jgi:hypothetical protein